MPSQPLDAGAFVRSARTTYRPTKRRILDPIRGAADAVGDLRRHFPHLGGEVQERFVVLGLDARHRTVAHWEATVGTLTATLVDARAIFAPAVAGHLAAVVVAHNHPSGDPDPSAADAEATARLVRAGRILAVQLLDHLVVAGPGLLRWRSIRSLHPDCWAGGSQ